MLSSAKGTSDASGRTSGRRALEARWGSEPDRLAVRTASLRALTLVPPVEDTPGSRLPPPHRKALTALAARLSDAEVRWAVTGSTAFALHGVAVIPRDLDIAADRAGAYALERVFADDVVEPVSPLESDRLRTLRGLLCLEGVMVEIVGDIRRRLPSGGWGRPLDPLRHAVLLPIERQQVPVLTPDYLYRAYVRLGRGDKAALLRPLLGTPQASQNTPEHRDFGTGARHRARL